MANRKLVVEVIGDSSSLEKAFAKSNKSVNRFGRNLDKTGKKSRGVFGGIGKTIGLASGALGAIGLAGAAKAAFTEMGEAQKVTAQTNAVLKSTGGIANVTAKQIDKQADALMRLSGMDDEAIKSGQNMLLTFTKIQNKVGKGNNIYDQATLATLNMSVAMKKDMASSAILVGKALNDPVKGVSALSKAGVQFDAPAKQMIKDLVQGRKAVDNLNRANIPLTLQQLDQAKKMEKLGKGWKDIASTLKLKLNPAQKKTLDYWERGGHEMEAQKMILKELNTQFGGQAKAFGGTLPQKINLLRESLLNLGGALAQKLAPEITKIVDKITDWLLKTENQDRIMRFAKDAAEVLTGALKFLRGALKKLNSITGSTKNSLILLLGALAAFKTIQILGRLSNIAGAIGGIGKKADDAAGTKATGVRGLVAALGGIKALGPVLALTIAISLIIKNKKEVSDWLKSHGLEAISHGIQNVTGLIRPRQGTGRTGPKPVSNLPNLPDLSGGNITPVPTPRPPKLPTRPPPRGTRSLYGAATIVNVNGNVITPDSDKFLRDMQKRAARSRAQQRGVRPGVNLGGA